LAPTGDLSFLDYPLATAADMIAVVSEKVVFPPTGYFPYAMRSFFTLAMPPASAILREYLLSTGAKV